MCSENGNPEDVLTNAYTYQLLRHQYLPPGSDCRPSLVYKTVILRGARENDLPAHYIKKLEDIEDNGYNGEVDFKVD